VADIKARRSELGKRTESIDKELESLGAKKERLGLAFADGALTKEVYTARLESSSRRRKSS